MIDIAKNDNPDLEYILCDENYNIPTKELIIIYTVALHIPPDEIIKKLSRILNEEIAVLLKRVREAADNPRHIPILLQEDIDWKPLVYIENNHYDLPGVRIEVLPRRDYLYEDFGSHMIGYLGQINLKELEEKNSANYQGGDQIGKRGFEKLYEFWRLFNW